MRTFLAILAILLHFSQANSQNSLSGYITDHSTGEPLIQAHIFIPDLQKGTTTDNTGLYKMEGLPRGSFLVEAGYLGYSTQVKKVKIDSATQLNIELEPAVVEMSEIVISGPSASTQRELNPVPTLVISGISSNKIPSGNLIDAIAGQPGISQITTGGAISKPVIRGLGYNRVVVLNNHIRQEGQQWGDEHGVEIDQYSIGRVEVVKGPGSLMYGSDAMAGVIHFLPPKPVQEGSITGGIIANYQTNNHMQGYSVMNAGNLNGISWLARISSKKAGNYSNRYDGPVYNSGFRELDYNGSVGINKKWGYSQIHLSRFGQKPGIVEGERDAIGHFLKPVVTGNSEVEEQSVTGDDLSGYGIGIPYQKISHQKLSSISKLFFKKTVLSVNLALQQNNRKEFANPVDKKEAELFFLLNTFNYDVKYLLPELNGWQPSAGMSGMYQKSYNKGEEFLIPEYNLFDAGLFVFLQKSYENWHVNGGVRYDYRNVLSKELFLDENDEPTDGGTPGAFMKFRGFHTGFSNISASTGVSYKISETFTGKLNFSRGFRAPNMAELGSNGVHEGTFRYEKGNNHLDPETSFQVDAGLIHQSEHASVEAAVFYTDIQHYIYLQKLRSVSGMDSIVNKADPVPVYGYVQGNALLYGGEFTIDIHPHPLDWLHFENSFSFVRGVQKHQPDNFKNLPFIPAPEIQSELRANFKKAGDYLRNLYLRAELNYTFSQNHILSAFGTETPTPHYALLDAGIGADISNKQGHKMFTLSVSGSNLLGKAYQSHLSRLKYAPENPATGRIGVFNMGRNISIRLAVPLQWNIAGSS